jgi:histidinol-phosphate aminotransferase
MFSERLKKLIPYVPGEQPQDRKYLKLNTNENPYPPSPRIRNFLKAFDIEALRLYPDPRFRNLREKIARRYGLQKEQVFIGNGSDEILSFAFYAFFDSTRGPVLFPRFTYSFYPVYCDFYGIEYERVPLDPTTFAVDLEGLLAMPASCGIIFANPNAPTGIGLPLEKIRSLLNAYSKEKVVIIDEAYVDYGAQSAVGLIEEHNNLLIMRTFSKSMSLAGLRLGFALGGRELIDALFTVKDSFNSYPADMLSLKIGEIAVADESYYRTITRKIIDAREYLSVELEKLGWHVLPSEANFVFAGKRGLPGREIYLRLKQEGILVRYFDIEGIKDFVRITIGKKDDMERFLDVARRCL